MPWTLHVHAMDAHGPLASPLDASPDPPLRFELRRRSTKPDTLLCPRACCSPLWNRLAATYLTPTSPTSPSPESPRPGRVRRRPPATSSAYKREPLLLIEHAKPLPSLLEPPRPLSRNIAQRRRPISTSPPVSRRRSIRLPSTPELQRQPLSSPSSTTSRHHPPPSPEPPTPYSAVPAPPLSSTTTTRLDRRSAPDPTAHPRVPFRKTEEPLDADDWLQTMENNVEVAGVEAVEKVLFATHYLSGPARAWWTSARAMNAGQMMTWEDFKTKFSKYHVPQGLIKKMRDEFRELKQGRMSVVEYRDRFLTLSRYAPDETDTNEKRKERFLNGLHDEMQTVLVNIPFADLEALVDSAIQMEGKLHQANENRKRRMMNQHGSSNTQKYRNNSSGGFTPKYNKPIAQTYRPNYTNNHGGPPKPGGNNNNNHTSNNNPNTNGNNNNNNNTGPKTGSNTVPLNSKDKSTITCYECGVVGHYSNECPKRLAKIAANTAAPAQNQRRFAARKNQNNNGRYYNMTATEAQEAPQNMPSMSSC
ncbi:hypothetical protein QYE76_053138 [Lolium multiflorum]|uniref:CCHC-type domain-containing protein n=1 Tax=Lolium multiflorum TaxID=4521 RepID=A0AAD8SWB7_LOLMU|nr:hypothetical protein QYE76_053138 [Lolium multiflorum]